MTQRPASVPGYFQPAVREWFSSRFAGPTPVQLQAWEAIRQERHTLIAAPTGSGKTLAAFLDAIDGLVRRGLQGGLEQRTRVLYVSPLKALSNDIHKNLELPLEGVARVLEDQGRLPPLIEAAVRTGDTPQGEREKMRRRPPHILVTTPESLNILLTSESGRAMLSGVETVIVDEIHAMAGSKRGAHLLLSLARLDALCGQAPVRIGLSATQKPIETIARFLCGDEDCRIVDTGYQRERDLQLELPSSPLTPVMAGEVWTEIYDRLAELSGAFRTTLIFVNTRRHAERVARHLAERLGEEAVTAHHGSLAREHRLDAEQRLKAGKLKALVATASLELGIDIGDVDLVCQLGSPRSIAAFLQRVGRSGHAVHATPRGRLFPLSRDDLVECAALLDAVRRGELDRIVMPRAPLDVLAQQVVAEVACREWDEDELFALVRRCWSYRELERDRFSAVLAMLAEGYSTRRGRRSAYLHRDVVNGRLRPRKGARLTAITNGGTIPDQFDYEVVLRPQDLRIGSLNEDFAFESLPGDIFQLGNTSYRIQKVTTGKVFVEDAHGQPPNIPFWFGEAPGRSDELSQAVSRLREELEQRLPDGRDAVLGWLTGELGLGEVAAVQLLDYLGLAAAALEGLPTRHRLVLERFFDETGDMHLVVHSVYGSRINRALGLGLRKKFCRRFNFELQAAALEDSLVLSLGETHSFALDEVMGWLKPESLRETLVQAAIQAPMFENRWRWVATIALAVKRMMGGDKRPPQFQRSDAEDLVAVVFPDQIACQDNVTGPREIPDHPLVEQTLHDCLTEVMDKAGARELLEDLGAGRVEVACRDLVHPSPLAEEILNARPYAFLDDGAAEERRTNAVRTRPDLSYEEAATLGRLDPAAIARVRAEAALEARDEDELHDGLLVAGFLLEREIEDIREGRGLLDSLVRAGRALRLATAGEPRWVARERLHEALAAWPEAPLQPSLDPLKETPDADEARRELLRSRLEILGPVSREQLQGDLECSDAELEAVLAALEVEGVAMRMEVEGEALWCNRRLLARIHHYSRQRKRGGYRPVDAACYHRFLAEWQRVRDPEGEGRGALEAVLERLEGWTAPARIWEQELLVGRLHRYWPDWLDELCASGRVAWYRRDAPAPAAGRRSQVVSTTPIALTPRAAVDHWLSTSSGDAPDCSGEARRVYDALTQGGALFTHDLQQATGLLEAQLEAALAELVALGRVNSDGFQGIRFLTRNARMRHRQEKYRKRGLAVAGLEDAGRWSLVRRRDGSDEDRWARVEHVARALLRRWGVVFRALLTMESGLPPWRDLLYVYRRLEAREEIRGGRFVDGFSGEQFADPGAPSRLQHWREASDEEPLVISACDPLNLTGVLVPGDRVAATAGHRLAWRGGVPVAAQVAGEVISLNGEPVDWALSQRLIRDPKGPAPSAADAARARGGLL